MIYERSCLMFRLRHNVIGYRIAEDQGLKARERVTTALARETASVEAMVSFDICSSEAHFRNYP